MVITAVFAAYFVGGIAGGADWATFAWTAALSVSSAIVMLTMPSLGAYADLRAAKKRLLILVTAGCVVSTAALSFAGPGGVTGVVLLAESHLAVHTWPELGAVTLDVYVCNLAGDNSAKARALLAALEAAFAPGRVEHHEVQRGVLP